jgi:hypothetical protein
MEVNSYVKFTADTVVHALHADPTVEGLLDERLIYRLSGKVEVQNFGQQRETVDFLWQGVHKGCVVLRVRASLSDDRIDAGADEDLSRIAAGGSDPALKRSYSRLWQVGGRRGR